MALSSTRYDLLRRGILLLVSFTRCLLAAHPSASFPLSNGMNSDAPADSPAHLDVGNGSDADKKGVGFWLIIVAICSSLFLGALELVSYVATHVLHYEAQVALDLRLLSLPHYRP